MVERVRYTPYGVPFGIAPGDLTFGATSVVRGYGVPNGVINNDDHFYYQALYAAPSPLADLTISATPGTTGYGVPDGTLNSDDYFYSLTLFGGDSRAIA